MAQETDYSKSRFQNRLAEEAYTRVADGHSADSIFSLDEVKFDLVHLDDEVVILRYDEQGFIDVEATSIDGDDAEGRWAELKKEYANGG